MGEPKLQNLRLHLGVEAMLAVVAGAKRLQIQLTPTQETQARELAAWLLSDTIREERAAEWAGASLEQLEAMARVIGLEVLRHVLCPPAAPE